MTATTVHEIRMQAWTLVSLLVLATASLVVSRWHLGPAQFPTALGIAAIKIALVALIFMGLSKARSSLRLALLVALILILSLVIVAGLDVATRQTSRAVATMPEGIPAD